MQTEWTKIPYQITIEEPYIAEIWETYPAQILEPYIEEHVKDLTVFEIESFTIDK